MLKLKLRICTVLNFSSFNSVINLQFKFVFLLYFSYIKIDSYVVH